jgi:hypothetical protein
MSKTVPWFWASGLAVFTLCACTPDAVVENRPDAAPGSATSPALVAPSSVAGTTPAAVRHRARDCTARDLVAHLRREHEGAGGHLVSLLDFGNASATRCRLSGYPRHVTLSEPGHRAVSATAGSFFPVRPSGPMKPGEVTTLGIETTSTCHARPGGGPGGPMFHTVRVTLRGGVVTVAAPRGLDVGCGVRVTEFTTWR